jgi:hypothetical protein
MAASSIVYPSFLAEQALLDNREALKRMIQYAWFEAEREGARECAELLSAALLALDQTGHHASVYSHLAPDGETIPS